MFIRQEFRLYPNKHQKSRLSGWIGCARKVWNIMLAKNIEQYETNKKFIFAYDMNSMLPVIKKDVETNYLKDCPSQVLQQKCQDLDTALKNTFKHKRGFPKFKSKKTDMSGIRFPQGVKYDDGKIYLPKIKDGIKFKMHREFLGEPGAVTIKRDKVGDYWVSILMKVEDSFCSEKVDIISSVGVDVGLKEFATLSDGSVIKNPKFGKKNKRKIKLAARKHSRKQKGSKNKEKSRIRLAKQHRKISRQRKEFVIQTAVSIAKEYDLISIEDLNIKGMVKNRKLAFSVSDVGFGMFFASLEWQCQKRGKHLNKISRWFPSSKTCSCCGSIKQDLTLSDRIYKCNECGHEMDRDLNAAINIDSVGSDEYRRNYGNIRLLDTNDGEVSLSDVAESFGVGSCVAKATQ